VWLTPRLNRVVKKTDCCTGAGRKPPSAPIDQLLTGPAESADVIVDFSAQAGAEFYLINEGPDEPFGGGVPGKDFLPADPNDRTGDEVRGRTTGFYGHEHRPHQPNLPTFTPLERESKTRKVSLNEEDSAVLEGVGPRAALL